MKAIRFIILLSVSLLLAACTDYDVETADTPPNRKGFARHLGFEPGSEVTAVYYYADELGANVQYQLSFECPKEVVERIIRDLSLQPRPEDYLGLDPRNDLKWWKPDSTEGRTMWIKKGKDGQHHLELWYSDEDGRAYYHEYSI
jgi:hypothetical protein